MNKVIKFISAGIIIVAFILGVTVAWKIAENIRQSYRQDLQESFKDSLDKHGKK